MGGGQGLSVVLRECVVNLLGMPNVTRGGQVEGGWWWGWGGV